MESLEAAVQAILERNRRVEAEKAWEVSITRRLFIALMTYAGAVLLFWSLGLPTPLLQAFIPSIAYFFSTLSLPWVKEWWMRRHRSER